MMRPLRLGKFNIQRTTILDNPELVKAITNGMIIFRAEMMMHKDAVEYIAVSNLFEEIQWGIEPPFYDIMIDNRMDTDGTYEVTAKRVSPL